MSVHYKFKSAVEYDTLPVDGLNISLGDLKEAIIQQKRLGKGQPYDLQITNAETKEVYTDEKTLIPKNSSLIVARVPIDPSQMKRPWENKDATALILANPSNLMNTEDAAEAAEIDRKIKEVTDLTRMEGSEQDKINAMVAQSTMDYHPSKYVKLRASKMTGIVPIGYKCYKCNKAGHWVTMCPLNNQDLRKSTGIPSMFLEEAKDPNAPGVMITQTGKLVRLRDMGGDNNTGKHIPPAERPAPPDELECQLCKEILKDAVLIPCCAVAYCDDCIRNHLLDSEEHVCPACGKEGIGPDTLIPNRYLRIKVQEFECGWLQRERKGDGLNDGGEALTSLPPHVLHPKVSPTPPHSPAHFPQSPARIRVSDKLMKSPASQTAASPVSERSPLRVNVVEPIDNGDAEHNEKPVAENKDIANEIHDASSELEAPTEQEQEEPQPTVEEKENIEMNEGDTSIDEKQKKIRKKKGKRKSSRHDSEEEKEEKKRKKKERSHKSQDKKSSSGERKSKRHGEVLKDVDLPDDKSDIWDSTNLDDSVSHETDEDKKRPRSKLILKDVPSEAVVSSDWTGDRVENRVPNRSRSNSGEKNDIPLYDNIVPFNPHVPPPNFVKSPPQGYQYPVTSTYPQVLPPVPVTTDTTYSHYQVGIPPPILSNPPLSYSRTHSSYNERELIADPLTEFQKHMREKDERDRKWRYSRSRSPSRSPRYRRVRSRSRQRSWSRSRSRSISRSRGGLSARSPRSQSRRRWSRSPPPRSHTYRSRSPSFSRERSISNRSLSLSRTPSPSRRIGTSPLHVLPVHPPVHPPVLPDPHMLARPPMDYGVPRDYNRFPMGSMAHDQYQPQPPYHTAPGHWDQHVRYNQGRPDNFKPNFRGRRGRGGFRQGENFDNRNQDYRYQDFRSQRMVDDRRGGIQAAGCWERENRPSFNTEIPRADRGNRHFEGERRRYGDATDCDESRPRRHDDHHAQNIYSDEEWRHSDEGRKREDDSERRRFEGRRGREERKDDSDDYDDLKRSRKDADSGKSYDRGYKDDDRSGRHERDSKPKSVSRRESPRDEDLHYRSKSYDSPGKNLKKSPVRERREKDNDRRDRDYDRRDREVDKKDKEDKRDREGDSRRDRDGDNRRDRDSDRRDWESDRRDRDSDKRSKENDRRDDRREREIGKQESDSKDYDRKDSYKREKDQDRKLRDVDRKDKEGDRRGRDLSKRDKDPLTKDKNDKSGEEIKKEKSYVTRWDHGDIKHKPDRDIEKKSKSRERDVAYGHEEKEHKRKSRRKEEKDEGHHGKEKCDGASENDSLSKLEKKKQDKKKRKKERRRASQASTEASQGEISGDEGEDKRKKKKRDKKRKAKGLSAEEGLEDVGDKVVSENMSGSDPKEPDNTGLSASSAEKESEPALHERSPDPKPSDESPTTHLPLPPLSKWERDEDLTLTPKGISENKAPEEEKKVTVDILKRAENTIFSGRGLASRKVFLDPQKQKEDEEQVRSPTPEWERSELREAKRRGPSIQITISSKTESQIGRPRGGRYQPSNPEHNDQKRYTLRSRRGSDLEKGEKQSRSQTQASVKSRRKSEKENSKEEKDNDNYNDKVDVNSDYNSSEKKLNDDVSSPLMKDNENDNEMTRELDSPHMSEAKTSEVNTCDNVDAKSEFHDSEVKPENVTVHKGVKRPSSSSADELDVKRVKADGNGDTVPSENNDFAPENSSNVNEKDTHALLDSEYPMLEENMKEEMMNVEITNAPIRGLLSDPMTTLEQELEEGEIPSDFSGDEVPKEPVVDDTPLELRGMVQSEMVEQPLKTGQLRYSPIRVPSPVVEESKSTEVLKVKEKTKKRKKRKRSSSSSSSNSSSSSSSSSSSEDEEIVKKKKKKKKKKKAAILSESSDGESQRKHKKKKKDKKKKKKKSKKKSDK
ncbi:E3 ubiquitin-protein ligase RBBP6-like isoform X2 [Macrobrachium nipponense]|uniref:E3 ubiquitin-protein ligase RBBP6-like isoform X2 n=1 Tax=Macrobrachium nipponense TaxID=159736 RepID=UPI0030C8B419